MNIQSIKNYLRQTYNYLPEVSRDSLNGDTDPGLHLLVEVVYPLLDRPELHQQLLHPVSLLGQLWPHYVGLWD